MQKIAVIGECMIELNGAPFADMQQTYGGDTLNTAVYLARISEAASVYYVTALGTDSLSRGMRMRWQEEGIRTDFVFEDAARQPGLYLIQLDARGERTFLYWRSTSAARYLLQHPQFSEFAAQIDCFDSVYCSGISLAILPEDDRKKLITLLAARSGGNVYDGNYRPKLWENKAQAQNITAALLPHIELALMTFDDEQALWGDSTPDDSIARLKQAGVKEIVLKLGADGARYIGQGIDITVPAVKVDTPIDTTAAGDSFNAGFLAARAAGKTPEDCCRTGCRLAAAVIQHRGAVIDKAFTTKEVLA